MRLPAKLHYAWVVAVVTFVAFGSYLEAFLFAGLLCFVAAAVALSIGAGGERAKPGRDAVPAA
jgi:hypothetical protein